MSHPLILLLLGLVVGAVGHAYLFSCGNPFARGGPRAAGYDYGYDRPPPRYYRERERYYGPPRYVDWR